MAAVVVAAAADAGVDQEVGLVGQLDRPAGGKQPGEKVILRVEVIPKAGKPQAYWWWSGGVLG